MGDRVEGQIALVTGAASGVGAATAELLAAEGATVVLSDVNEAMGMKTAERIGRGASFLKLDVSSSESWQAAMAPSR